MLGGHGSDFAVEFTMDGDDVIITPPAVNPGNMPCSHAWTFKIAK